MSKLVSRPPVKKVILDYASNNVGPSAYVEVVSSMNVPANGLEIFNGSGSVMTIARGAAGLEVPVPYYILPGGSNIFLPLEFSNGDRISVKTADSTTAAIGSLVLNFFG